MRNKEHGMTPLEMVKIIEGVPQATLYRHIQAMLDAGIIRVINEKKVKSVSEKYYALNEMEATIKAEEWKKASAAKKRDYVSLYQLSILTQYQNYLKQVEEQNGEEDAATFSMVELKLAEDHFMQFQTELNELMTKYYHASGKEKDAPVRTIALTIIPES